MDVSCYTRVIKRGDYDARLNFLAGPVESPTFRHTLVFQEVVKLSRYMPWRHMGREEVQLLLILTLGTKWR
jgi:hypothetical protein